MASVRHVMPVYLAEKRERSVLLVLRGSRLRAAVSNLLQKINHALHRYECGPDITAEL